MERQVEFRAVIFDLDGVICHTDKYHYSAWKQIADRLGIPFNEAVNNRLRGVGRMDSLEIILEKYPYTLSMKEKTALAESKNAIYRELLFQMTPADISGDVRDTLKKLRDGGLLLAIGSSSKNAPLILERTGLEGLFDVVSDGNNITKSKPDPEVFLYAAQRLGVEPCACLVVEDAESGVLAAHNAGMKCAATGDAVNCGLADYNLTLLSDLLVLIGL